MTETNYRRGYRAERRAADELRRAGYVVARTAGSRSPFDLVAVGSAGVRLIQVKRVKERSPAAALARAREEFLQVPTGPGHACEVWVWRDGDGWVAREVVPVRVRR